MTEERKDGMTDQSGKKLSVEDGVSKAADAVQAALQNVVPHWQALTLLGFLREAVEELRNYVTRGKRGISWRQPFVQLEYDFPLVEIEDASTEDLGEMTTEDLHALVERMLKPDFLEMGLLVSLTRDVRVLLERGGRGQIALPPDVDKEVSDLPEAGQEAKLEDLEKGFELPRLSGSGTVDTPAGELPFAFALLFAVRPLHYNPKKRRAFFPVQVGLDFTEGDPSAWPKDARKEFWSVLFKTIDGLAAEFEAEQEQRPAVPKPDRAVTILPDSFAVPAGYVPMHRLAERRRSGLPLFEGQRREFYELRTPLNWAVGLALFSVTSERTPGDWQEITIADLEDRVFCLTERDARRRGDHRTDVLVEVVKLHSTKNAYVRYDWERRGRFWHRTIALGSDYAIPNFELVFIDTSTGRPVYPSDPNLRSFVVPLKVKGRRAYTPDGKDIKALPSDRFRPDRIRWRWNPSFADDLLAAPALDKKGNVKKDAKGKVLRTGFNIQVAVRIFDALFRLRSERAYLACRLLILLAHDIYKPPKQSTSAGRNVIEREADRLFDLLGLEADSKHPGRREEMVAAGIARLMEKDIGALLPTSDTTPRTDPNPERRKGPYYRLVRSPDYTPAAALVTKDEAAVLEAEAAGDAALALPPVSSDLNADQAVLPGMEAPPADPIPSGADIRAAREGAGVTLRDFAKTIGGASFNTWSRYERGEAIRARSITPGDWQRVRDFIGQHSKKGSA